MEGKKRKNSRETIRKESMNASKEKKLFCYLKNLPNFQETFRTFEFPRKKNDGLKIL